MKRRIFHTLISLLIVLFVVMGVMLGWIMSTNQGTRWLLNVVANRSSFPISARTIEGRLVDRLIITDARISLPGQDISVKTIHFAWNPFFLLIGIVDIESLCLSGVVVESHPPLEEKKRMDFSWPRVSWVVAKFRGSLSQLEINNLSYRSPGEKPITLMRLITKARWENGKLFLDTISAASDLGDLSGALIAGLRSPLLQADISVVLKEPVYGINSFALQTKLTGGTRAEELAGKITLTASQQKSSEAAKLTGTLRIMHRGVSITDALLVGLTPRGSVTGHASVRFPRTEPTFSFRVRMADVQLEAGVKPVFLSGTIDGKGNLSQYGGSFALQTKRNGRRGASLAGSYAGSRVGIAVTDMNADIFGGVVRGSAEVNWQEGLKAHAALEGKGFNPATLVAGWKGVLNISLETSMIWYKQAPVQGEIHATLDQSRLQNAPLTGVLDAGLRGESIQISRLLVEGKNFKVTAAGDSYNGITIRAEGEDISYLAANMSGSFQATSVVRRRKEKVSGTLAVKGRDLGWGETVVRQLDLDARFDQAKGFSLNLNALLRDVNYGKVHVDAADLRIQGSPPEHKMEGSLLAASTRAWITLEGSYDKERWRGKITSLSGQDRIGPWRLVAPAPYEISSRVIRFGPLEVKGASSEKLEFNFTRDMKTESMTAKAAWSALRLARFNDLLKGTAVSGMSNGEIDARVESDKRIKIAAHASMEGNVTLDRERVGFKSNVMLKAGEKGMQGSVELHVPNNGTLTGSLDAPGPAYLGLPEKGGFSLQWSEIDLRLARLWSPAGIVPDGSLSGKANGRFMQAQRFAVQGEAVLNRGRLTWRVADREISMHMRSSSLSFAWKDTRLEGDFRIALAENGMAEGKFQLPLRAQIPVSVVRTGNLRASIKGRFVEKGLLTALVHGAVRETSGTMDFDLRAGGTLENPELRGNLRLHGAAAYLPMIGIHVRDVELGARFEDQTIHVDSFRAASGPGEIRGSGMVRAQGFRIAHYEGKILGTQFQTIHLPELRVQSSPQLEFEGNPGYLKVRGEVVLREFHILGQQVQTIGPSPDVILEGKPPEPKAEPLALDVRVRFIFGERVFVKVKGIDAQLAGDITLQTEDLDHITSTGEIKVVKGRYKTYGVDLQIERGRLFYAGGPIREPTLDILALRKIADVRAGVSVGGTIQNPVIKLYAEPPMPDVDILAYIVLGHPLGNSAEQANVLAAAANALLSASQSVVLQDRIKSRLGLSTLEIGATTDTSSYLGYKPITVTPPGTRPAVAEQSELARTMVTIGKYLTPQLYVSYGRSVFTGENQFLLRYDIYKKWQVETQTGNETGVDLYYKIEFE